jgi:hypothetical protein
LLELALNLVEVLLPVGLKVPDGDPIESMRTFVGSNTPPRRIEVVPAVDLVDERVGLGTNTPLAVYESGARL